MTEIQLPDYIQNPRQVIIYDEPHNICDYLFPDSYTQTYSCSNNDVVFFFPQNETSTFREFQLINEQIVKIGLPAPDYSIVRAAFFENGKAYGNEYKGLLGFAHMYYEFLGLQEFRSPIGSTKNFTVSQVINDWKSLVMNDQLEFEDCIWHFRDNKQKEIITLFEHMNKSHIEDKFDENIYIMSFFYKEARIIYEFLQHFDHFSPEKGVDQPFDSLVHEKTNKAEFMEEINTHVYDWKYQSILLPMKDRIASYFSNGLIFTALDKVASDQDLIVPIAKIEEKIIRQWPMKDGSTLELLPKEALSICPEDYAEEATFNPNNYNDAKQKLNLIVAKIDELENNGWKNVGLILSIAIIRTLEVDGERYFNPWYVWQKFDDQIKYLDSIKIYDGFQLLHPWSEQIENFGKRWGNKLENWTNLLVQEEEAKEEMAKNTTIKQRCTEMAAALWRFKNENQNVDMSEVNKDVKERYDKLKKNQSLTSSALIYSTMLTEIINEIGQYDTAISQQQMERVGTDKNIFLEMLMRWYFIEEYVYSSPHNQQTMEARVTDAWNLHPFSPEAIEFIRTLGGSRTTKQEYMQWLGEISLFDSLIKIFSEGIPYSYGTWSEIWQEKVKEWDKKVMEEYPPIYQQNINDLVKASQETGEPNRLIATEEGRIDLEWLTRKQIVRKYYWQHKTDYENFMKIYPQAESSIMKEWLITKSKEFKRQEQIAIQEQQENWEAEEQAENVQVPTISKENRKQSVQTRPMTNEEFAKEMDNWEKLWSDNVKKIHNKVPFCKPETYLALIKKCFEEVVEIKAKSTENYDLPSIATFDDLKVVLEVENQTIINQIIDSLIIDLCNFQDMELFDNQEEINKFKENNQITNTFNDINIICQKIEQEIQSIAKKLNNEVFYQLQRKGEIEKGLDDETFYQVNVIEYIKNMRSQGRFVDKNNLIAHLQQQLSGSLYSLYRQKYQNEYLGVVQSLTRNLPFSEAKQLEIASRFQREDQGENADPKLNEMSRLVKESDFEHAKNILLNEDKDKLNLMVEEWTEIFDSRSESISEILKIKENLGQINQSTFKTEKLRLENKYINDKLEDDNLDSELNEELNSIKRQFHEERVKDYSQRIINIYQSNHVVINNEILQSEIQKVMSKLTEREREIEMNNIEINVKNEKKEQKNKYIQAFEDQKINRNIELINEIHQFISRVPYYDKNNVHQYLLSEIRKLNTEEERTTFITNQANEWGSKFAEALGVQNSYYASEILNLWRRSDRQVTEDDLIAKEGTIMYQIQKSDTIAGKEQVFRKYLEDWDKDESFIKAKVTDIVLIIKQICVLQNKQFNERGWRQEIFDNQIKPYHDQKIVLTKLNEREEKEKENLQRIENENLLNQLKKQYQDAYGPEYSEEKWNELLTDDVVKNHKYDDIRKKISDKNIANGSEKSNLINTVKEIFSNFPDYNPNESPEALIAVLKQNNPEYQTDKKLEDVLKANKETFEKIGKIFKTWNENLKGGYYLGVDVFRNSRWNIPMFIQSAGNYECGYRLIQFNTEDYIHCLRSTQDPKEQNDNIKRRLGEFESKMRRNLANKKYKEKIDSYTKNLNVDDKENITKDIIGHCDTEDSIDLYMSLRSAFYGSGQDPKSWDSKVQFISWMKQNDGKTDLSKRITVRLKKDMSKADQDKITSFENELHSINANKFNAGYFNQKLYTDFKEDGNKYLAYLEGESIFQKYLKIFPNTLRFTNFFDYMQNQDVFDAKDGVLTEFQTYSARYTALSDPKVQKALRDWNEIANDNEKDSTETLVWKYPTGDIGMVAQSLQNRVQQRINSMDDSSSLGKAIQYWRSFFPEDMRTSTDWITDFGDNYTAINAIRKLTELYRFWAIVHPTKIIDLKEYIDKNANGNVETAKVKLKEFRDKYYSKWTTWMKNSQIRRFWQENESETSQTVDYMMNQTFLIFDGSISNGLKFINAWRSYQEMDDSFSDRKYSGLIEFLEDYSAQKGTDKENMISRIQTNVDSYQERKTTWQNDQNFANARHYHSQLDSNHQLNVKPDLKWDEETMYSNYLLPLAKKYYHQITGKDYIVTTDDTKDVSLTNSKHYQKILEAARSYQKKNKDWGSAKVESTYNVYHANQWINNRMTYEILKDKFKTSEEALDYLDHEKYKNTLLEMIGKSNEDEIPNESAFTEYHNLKTYKEKLNWLKQKVGIENQRRNTAWNSQTFVDLVSKYHSKHEGDLLRATPQACMITYQLDYEKAKTDLDYLVHLQEYEDEMEEPYSINSIGELTDTQKKEHTAKMKKIIKNYETYKNDNELGTKLNKYNEYQNKDSTETKLSLCKTWKENIARAKMWLDCQNKKYDILKLQPNEQGLDLIAEKGSTEALNELEKKYKTYSKDDRSFQSEYFQNLLSKYNRIKRLTNDVDDCKREWTTYLRSVQEMEIAILEDDLQKNFHLDPVELTTLNDSKDRAKTLRNLENKKTQLTDIKTRVNWNDATRRFYDQLSHFDSNLPTLQEWLEDKKYNLEELRYEILSTLWEKLTGNTPKKFGDYKAANESLTNLINNWNERKRLFENDFVLGEEFRSQNCQVSLDKLLKKFENGTNPSSDLLDARRYMKNKRNEFEYGIYLQAIGESDSKLSTLPDEIEKSNYLNSKFIESQQNATKWGQLYKKYKDYWNSWSSEKLFKWEDLYKKYQGKYDKAHEEWSLENLKKKYKEITNEDCHIEQFKKIFNQDNKWLIERLEYALPIYEQYYQNNRTYLDNFNQHNLIFTKEKKTHLEMVNQFETNVTAAANHLLYKINQDRLERAGLWDKTKWKEHDPNDVQEMDLIVKTQQQKAKDIMNDTDIKDLYEKYKVIYKEDSRDLHDIAKDNKYLIKEVENFFKIKIKIDEINENYKTTFVYENRSSWGNTSTRQYEYLVKKEKEIHDEYSKLNQIQRIDSLLEEYRTYTNKTGIQLLDLFNEKNQNAYETYYHMLITKWNYYNPLDSKTEDYSGNLRKACQELQLKLTRIQQIVSTYDRIEEWKKLDLETKDQIIKAYKDYDYGNIRIQCAEKIKTYDETHQDNKFDIDQTIKLWKKQGKDIKNIPFYLDYLNKYHEDVPYKESLNKFNAEYPGVFDDHKKELLNEYEIRKFLMLYPIQQRLKVAYKRDWDFEEMMELPMNLKKNHKVVWDTKNDVDLMFDFKTAAKANEAKAQYREYLNIQGFSKKDRQSLGNLKSFEGMIDQDAIDEEQAVNEKRIDAIILEFKQKMEKLKQQSTKEIQEGIAMINKNQGEDDKFKEEDLQKLSVNPKDLNIISVISPFLKVYNDHFNSKMKLTEINKLQTDQKNPNWIEVLCKIAFMPLIDDHNAIQRKQKNMVRMKVDDVINQYIITNQNVPDLKSITVENVLTAHKEYREQVSKEKTEYFKTLLEEYRKINGGDSSESLEDLNKLFPNVDDLERYLRINCYIMKINSVHKELKTKYKKENIDEKWDTYSKKPIDNLEPTILLLRNKLREVEKVLKEEQEKEDKEKKHKEKVVSKLNDLNSVRRRVGLGEIGFERYKNMTTESALSDISNMMNEARQKEVEKNNQQNSNFVGGALRNNVTNPLFSKPINNTNSTTTATPTSTKIPTINDGTEKKEEENGSVWSKNYEGGITSLIQQSSKGGISIRQLLMEQQKKNKLSGRPNLMSQFNPNAEPKPVVSYSSNLFSSKNNNMSDQNKEEKEITTSIEKKPILSPISDKPLTMTKIEPGKKINLLPTKVDEPEVVRTRTMTHILPRRGQKNAALRHKAKEQMIQQKQEKIQMKEEKDVEIEDDEEVEEKPKKPVINTKAKGNKQFQKPKSERTKALKRTTKTTTPKKKVTKEIEETDTIISKQDIKKKTITKEKSKRRIKT